MKVPDRRSAPVRPTRGTLQISPILRHAPPPLLTAALLLLFTAGSLSACRLPGSRDSPESLESPDPGPGSALDENIPAGFRALSDPNPNDSNDPTPATPAHSQRESARASRPSLVLRVSPALSDPQAHRAARQAIRQYAVVRAALHSALPAGARTNPGAIRSAVDPGESPWRLVLYANAAEYNRHARRQSDLLPRSRSRYDSRSRSLHITATAPPADWRHEWAHAILSDLRSDLPYWLHEGLALLLEETADLSRPARLPRRVSALREPVLRHVQRGGLADLLLQKPPGPLAGPTAAWFCAYLSEQGIQQEQGAGKTGNDLAAGLRGALRTGEFAWPAQSLPDHGIGTQDGRRKLRADFLNWLEREN